MANEMSAYGAWIYDEQFRHWRPRVLLNVTETETKVTIQVTAQLNTGYYYTNSENGEDKSLSGQITYTIGGRAVTLSSKYIPFQNNPEGTLRSFDVFSFSVNKGHEPQIVTVSVTIQGIEYSGYYWDRNINQPEKSTATQTLTVAALASYNITYNANGGNGAPTPQTKYFGESVTLKTQQPTRSGYKFLGWGLSATATTAKYSAGGNNVYSDNANLDLYAVWQRIYTISYNTNGGIPSSIPSQQKLQGESITLSRTQPRKTGYIFEGWATSANSTVVKYAPGSNYSNNADLNLYAVWTIITFTITFNSNGGSWSGPETQTKEYGTTLTLTSVEPTRTGYSFARWGTNSDGSGIQYQSGGSYIKDEDAILYALWRTTINYNANGGTGEMAPSNTFSSVNLRWNSFTRIGYKFIGWNTKADGTGIGYDDGATYSGENVILYAQWKEIPWIDSITYQKEEDGVSQQIKFFIGTTFDRVYDTVARGFSLQDLAIALKRFFKKQAFMIYAGNKPADYSKVMEWYAISGDTSDLEVDPALIIIDSDI